MKGVVLRGNNTLELYITYLKGMLERYESLPELFANDEILVNSLLNPQTPGRIEELNRYLETVNNISDTSDTYLMNRDGLTIAASNWQEERPFVGRNFSYRPYFKEAMQGVLGRYFALGTTSQRRGYYFAYPVRKSGEILGAVVVKVDVDSAEKGWAHLEQKIVVTDPDGVVFITTHPPWRFKVFGELDTTTRQRIEKSRRYPIATLSSLEKSILSELQEGMLVSIRDRSEKKTREYLTQVKKMEHAGWQVQILSDISELKKSALRSMLYTLAFFGFVVFLSVLFFQRQRRMLQLKEFEAETRKMLQQSNEELESRVLERTAELTESNRRLVQEITDREKTEQALQQTKDELLHAARMAALGQLSAGINHELNQPLAAIRSYAENGSLFLDKARHDETRYNLEQIAELTERMGQVVAQLKLFSRKSTGKTVRVALHGVIDGALEILKPSMRKSEVKIQVTLSPENLEVLANNVLLQQVFVNLINNAVQAVETIPEPEVLIEAMKTGDLVTVRVHDNGIGIASDNQEKIFEPFYTTKKTGQGLGLGLTISERILHEMGGTISATSDESGTVFEVILKSVSD